MQFSVGFSLLQHKFAMIQITQWYIYTYLSDLKCIWYIRVHTMYIIYISDGFTYMHAICILIVIGWGREKSGLAYIKLFLSREFEFKKQSKKQPDKQTDGQTKR